jgi:hypothetical protein
LVLLRGFDVFLTCALRGRRCLRRSNSDGALGARV